MLAGEDGARLIDGLATGQDLDDHRIARAGQGVGAEVAPSLFSIFALSATTAALCFAAVTLYSTSSQNTAERDLNIAGWQRIAADSDEFAVN